mmetsp:Transcript_5768/g.11679  ORF Transcript_5768/g.11679 Transcript_5768/m.11679 type:complete len:307 (-) Transcript_5768:25-945(-)
MSDDESCRRLNESSLWKENSYELDHTAVWGSWYDREAKRWGYACCHSVQRDSSCKAGAAGAAGAARADAASGEEPEGPGEASSDEDSESEARRIAQLVAEQRVDWSTPPAELLPRDQMAKAGEFIEHFVRFILGAWRREHARSFAGFRDLERATFQDSLGQTEEAMVPLLRRLRSGETLDRGEAKAQVKKRSRTARQCQDGTTVGEQSVLEQLDRMVSLAAEREYAEAHEAYTRLTLGNKRWHSTTVMHVPACQMKGAREYRRNRDDLNTYDMDPVAQRYMHGMRKLVQFACCIRPNSDQSKNVML